MFTLNIIFLNYFSEQNKRKKMALCQGNYSVRLEMKYVIAGNRKAKQSKGWDHPSCLSAG